MEKNSQIHIQEVQFGSSDSKGASKIKSLLKKRLIRKIAPRLYTSNFQESEEVIVRRNWYHILSNQYPDAMLSHRSALEFRPTSDGHIFLTYTYTKNIKLPGLIIHFIKGHKPIEGDNIFIEKLFCSQEARAYLENLQESRKSDSVLKTLPLKEIEEKLELILKVKNEKELNNLRDRARSIAPNLGMEKEFKKLDRIIGALLTTQTSKILTSDIAKARVLGEPIDGHRIKLLEILYTALTDGVSPEYMDKNQALVSYQNFAFFEGYFSNYIEGTKFEVEEAKQIITSGMPLPARDEDSHDVLGTYQIISDRNEMATCPKDAKHFLTILQYRHKTILEYRSSKNPGAFKHKNNFAGDTAFVDFNLVRGTLTKGFDYYLALRHPFAKAVYMMFLVSEVHPFLDGNGRVARIMMNAELSSQRQSKIIIPTVYREDYIVALRRLTRQSEPIPYIKMLQRAYEFSKNIFDYDLDSMEKYLRACDAFKEPTLGLLKNIPRDELNREEELEVKYAAGKTIHLQHIEIANQNLADFSLAYRIVNTESGEEFKSSSVYFGAGPYHKNISSMEIDDSIIVPYNCICFIKLQYMPAPHAFQGRGILQYTLS